MAGSVRVAVAARVALVLRRAGLPRALRQRGAPRGDRADHRQRDADRGASHGDALERLAARDARAVVAVEQVTVAKRVERQLDRSRVEARLGAQSVAVALAVAGAPDGGGRTVQRMGAAAGLVEDEQLLPISWTATESLRATGRSAMGATYTAQRRDGRKLGASDQRLKGHAQRAARPSRGVPRLRLTPR